MHVTDPAKVSAAQLDVVLTADAVRLARRHKGDFDRLVRDPEVRVSTFRKAAQFEIAFRGLDYGLDEVKRVTPLGVCTYEEDGSHSIMIYDRLSLGEELRVRAHEVGHARARTLLNDRSEHAANVWGEAWQQAALQWHLRRR